MTTKRLFLLCGGNGAGKTTFYRLNLEPAGIPFVNADELAKLLVGLPTAERDQVAWQKARQIYQRMIESGESFAYETVFSHTSKLDLINDAKARGYEVLLFYVFLDSPDLHDKRVKLGFQQNTRHDVPTEKVLARLERVNALMIDAIRAVDEAAIFNNSDSHHPFRLVGRFRSGKPDPKVTLDLPTWLEAIL